MILFTHTITSRLQYITDFIGKEILGNSFQILTDKETFRQSYEPKINYSDEKISDDEFWIKPHSLLFEKNIREQAIECSEQKGQKVFFKTDGNIPFDIFAATFYLLSRYEEYLPYQKDMYGRYAHENSLAFKENFLQRPLINLWLNDFKNALQIKFSNLKLQTSNFKLLPTYDIDIAYSYRSKGFIRNAGGMLKSIVNGQWSIMSDRLKVLNGSMKDPYDSYEWMDKLHEQYKLQPRYFFLIPYKNSIYDKNILPNKKTLQQLIKQQTAKYDIGIHPSWQSGDDSSLMKKEIETLENISGKKITTSRQHYIRFTLPLTFRYLIEAGIKEDFSIGYGSINGFRASVASSFYWYDLEKEKATDLLLHPFCYMEANSFYEQKFSAEQSFKEMMEYYNIVRSVNGTFISIWHNNFLGTDKLFKGWKEIYEKFIETVSSSG